MVKVEVVGEGNFNFDNEAPCSLDTACDSAGAIRADASFDGGVNLLVTLFDTIGCFTPILLFTLTLKLGLAIDVTG